MANIRGLKNIKQTFHHYETWEDYKSGMYQPPCIESLDSGISSAERIEKAICLLSNARLCREYMQKVVTEWPIATEEVLTNPESNGRAWLGQCACFMYARCHDEETRKAWVLLKPSVQVTANRIAEQVIKAWLTEYSKRCPNYQTSLFDGGELT